MMDFKTIQEVSAELRSAMESGDSKKIETAWEGVCNASAEQAYARVQQDIELYKETQDERILEKRGIRKLTSKEEQWYGKLIDVMKSANPKQAFTEIIDTDNEDDIMPSTIIEDVFRNLVETHPLLSKISTQSVQYLTKWVLNKHTPQSAAWGAITSEITEEITSDLKVIDIKQNKLSCFVILEKGYADLGPVFLDSYIREVMADAMAVGLETAIVTGSGEGMPAGMDRSLLDADYTKGVGYTQKTAVTITDFTPASYGALLAGFSKDEDGKSRTVTGVTIICNQEDYFTKIMPATTVMTVNATYVNNLFPFPTEVIISNVVPTGTAIIGILSEYILFVGQASRNNVIEYSDEYKFLEDQRVFKVVQYADGRAYDNTSFQLLDISGLEPGYVNVKEVTA